MAVSGLRDREDIALDLVGVAGLTALAAGLVLLAPSEELGFDAAVAIDGVVSQLPVTLPAAVIVLAVTALDLAAGLALARAARRVPFASTGEALLAAAVASVAKNAVLLGVLGFVGWFRAPVLLVANVALAAPLLAVAVRGRAWAHVWAGWRDRPPSLGSPPLAALAIVVWSGPLLLQLASPVVPFVDVLPNHVAPAEHLRAFGAFDPLTATQSPIYGPSRSLLGYVGWLGAITTLSGLPAALAISAFILPSTVLVAVGAHRLARALVGPALPLGPWVVLAFAMTTSFARLGDVRGTVVVLPLVLAAFALVADRLREPAAPDPWWPGSGTVTGLALGAAVLLHPVIGALAVATVALVAMARPDVLAVGGTVAAVIASILALPQALTMVGLALPSVALAAAVGAGFVLGAALERSAARPGSAVGTYLEWIVRRLPVVLVAVVAGLAIVALLAIPGLLEGLGPGSVMTATELLLDAIAILLIVLAVGLAIGSPAARSPLVLFAAVVGIATAIGTQLIPGDAGLLARALRFELPKTLHYWIPVAVAIGAGASLALVRASPRLPRAARPMLLGAFVVAAALPLRPEPIDAFHLGERRWSEALAFDLRSAATGFWRGYRDPRRVLDGPGTELVAAVRAEIAAGRLGPDTGVLHVGRSFQQWDGTPLGVFAGVTETTVSPDAEFSIHTVGGRLQRIEDLDGLLASGAYVYVLLEPSDELPPDARDRIVAAGFRPIFANDRGELFAAGT